MDTLLSLIDNYGTAVYIILFLYCALKSGALPLFGGYAAQQGVLEPLIVSAAALSGAYLGGVGYQFGRLIEEAVTRGRGMFSVGLLLVSVLLIWLGFRKVARDIKSDVMG